MPLCICAAVISLLRFFLLAVLFCVFRSHFIFALVRSIHSAVLSCRVSLWIRPSRMMLFGDNLRRVTHFTSFDPIFNGFLSLFALLRVALHLAPGVFSLRFGARYCLAPRVFGCFVWVGNGYSSFAFSVGTTTTTATAHTKQFIVVTLNFGWRFFSLVVVAVVA